MAAEADSGAAADAMSAMAHDQIWLASRSAGSAPRHSRCAEWKMPKPSLSCTARKPSGTPLPAMICLHSITCCRPVEQRCASVPVSSCIADWAGTMQETCVRLPPAAAHGRAHAAAAGHGHGRLEQAARSCTPLPRQPAGPQPRHAHAGARCRLASSIHDVLALLPGWGLAVCELALSMRTML